MARSDYAHWNEEQDRVWWEEEGKHHGDEEPYDLDPSDADYGREYDDPEHETRDDCLRDCSFSQERDGYPWRCHICGDEFPVGWKPGDALPESLKVVLPPDPHPELGNEQESMRAYRESTGDDDDYGS